MRSKAVKRALAERARTDDLFQMPRERDSAEDMFAAQCERYRLPPFERQFRFAAQLVPPRQWRFDVAFPSHMLAVEIDGLVVHRVNGRMIVTGRHASVEGINGDNEKINRAILAGWSVLRFTQRQVHPLEAIETTMRVLHARGWQQ